MNTVFKNTSPQIAQELDARDSLAAMRQQFYHADDTIYLDGNSLGRLPLATVEQSHQTVREEWGQDLIRSWNSSWLPRMARLSGRLAHLVGARPEDLLITDSTSLNLYKLTWAALDFQAPKSDILSDELNFPADHYIFQGILRTRKSQGTLKLIPSSDGISTALNDVETALKSKPAVLSLSLVSYKSAFRYDLQAITEIAHSEGALVLWDLSHATGVVPIDLEKANVDLAVGCTYKYLNGGPGSPAFLYVHPRLQDQLESPIQGWFGDSNPFEFHSEYQPATGVQRFMGGTPPMLSLSALENGLEILNQAGIAAIREKSVRLTEYLWYLVENCLLDFGFTCASPRESAQRGSHLALSHPQAYKICSALLDRDVGKRVVITDFREPDILRLGLVPVYNSFEEIHTAVDEVVAIMTSGSYEKYPAARQGVT